MATVDRHARAPRRETPAPDSVPIGAPVYSRDGRRLGVVKQVQERCFLVDARLAFDYWLSTRCVAVVDGGQVRLGVNKRDVGDYLVDMDCPEDFEDLEPVVTGERPFTLSSTASLQ